MGQNKRSGVTALAICCTITIAAAGCNSATRRSAGSSPASSNPALTGEAGGTQVAVVEPGASASASSYTPQPGGVVDRHPLFSKPAQYYESTRSNKAVKTAAAVVVGVPAGIVGELKQIVVGVPAAKASSLN